MTTALHANAACCLGGGRMPARAVPVSWPGELTVSSRSRWSHADSRSRHRSSGLRSRPPGALRTHRSVPPRSAFTAERHRRSQRSATDVHSSAPRGPTTVESGPTGPIARSAPGHREIATSDREIGSRPPRDRSLTGASQAVVFLVIEARRPPLAAPAVGAATGRRRHLPPGAGFVRAEL